MSDANTNYACAHCDKPIQNEEPYWDWVMVNAGMADFLPAHMECTPNEHRPDEHKVCDVCGITGKDERGEYAGLFVYGQVQHPSHVDWDAVRKTLDAMMED
jgi:hypothetical protein